MFDKVFPLAAVLVGNVSVDLILPFASDEEGDTVLFDVFLFVGKSIGVVHLAVVRGAQLTAPTALVRLTERT